MSANSTNNNHQQQIDEETRNQIQQLQHTRGSRYRELLYLNLFARMHEALLQQFGRCQQQVEENDT
jgi:hypothetical protein